jgi:hypothetical protein
MAIRAVRGQMADAKIRALMEGLEIAAVDFDPFSSEELLRPSKHVGQPYPPTKTDGNGSFSFSYTRD